MSKEICKTKCLCSNRLEGKVALVTGGNSGIGLETARDLARRGACVVIASRDERKSATSVADIVATTGNPHVHHRQLDLTSFANIRRFAADFIRDYPRLDLLVNNAGCLGNNQTLTEDGINSVMQINHFGPFLLTHLLMDALVAAKPSRIVIVSSVSHHFAILNTDDLLGHQEIFYMTTYSNSKLCNLLWTKALAKELPEGVTVNALHPGAVGTDIFQAMGSAPGKFVRWFFGTVFKSPVEGAQTTVHLCVSDAVAGSSGKYYSDCNPEWTSRISEKEELIERVYQQSKIITKC